MSSESKKLKNYRFDFEENVKVDYERITLNSSNKSVPDLPELAIPVLLYIAINETVDYYPSTKQLTMNFNVERRKIYYTLNQLRNRGFILSATSGVSQIIDNRITRHRINPEKQRKILEIFGVNSFVDLYKRKKNKQ